MAKATSPSGRLIPIDNCKLSIPGYSDIVVTNLPDIGDSKNAVYDGTNIIGRSSPLHTYHYSDTRNISIQFHFFITTSSGSGSAEQNLNDCRAIMSCAYPRAGSGGAPFSPPPICTFRCGNLLAVDQDLCLVLQQYSIKWPTDVAWDLDTYCPYKFDIDTNWMVVYTSPDLPDQSRILKSGR